jgi:hypothetical protein
MINSKLQSIMGRLSNIDDTYKRPLSMESLYNIKNSLNITLPEDFIFLNKICRCDFFNFFDFYNFDIGVVSETKGWREGINLPNNYLVLCDDGTSAVLMKIDNDQDSVIWCALEDVLNLCDGEPMIYNPTIFPSFTDFYEFLLDEEEKSRAENT